MPDYLELSIKWLQTTGSYRLHCYSHARNPPCRRQSLGAQTLLLTCLTLAALGGLPKQSSAETFLWPRKESLFSILEPPTESLQVQSLSIHRARKHDAATRLRPRYIPCSHCDPFVKVPLFGVFGGLGLMRLQDRSRKAASLEPELSGS